MPRQLYVEYKNCSFPRTAATPFQTSPHFALISWPNGKPCTLINYWLMHLESYTTGKTVKQYCANITPFVRNCYTKRKLLVEFDDEDMHALALELIEQIDTKGERVRQNNQVNTILSTIIEFLIWVQTEGCPADHKNLVGLKGSSPLITIRESKNSYGKTTREHDSFVTANTPIHPKSAMPLKYIQALEDQIFYESDPELFKAGSKHRYNSLRPESLDRQAYLYERRSFTFWLMKRTGLRPSEMALLPLEKNRNPAANNILYIPTKKRRTNRLTLRPFKLTDDGALRVMLYLDARQSFVNKLLERGVIISDLGSFFLTENGGSIGEQSMSQDFSRIVKRAGLSDVRVCFSMFRHRFITQEILVYIKETFNDKTPNRHMISTPIIKSIEERIRRKTGHKIGDSIWNYLDIAFEAIDLWKSAEDALSQIDQFNDSEDKLQRLRYDQRSAQDCNVGIDERISRLETEIRLLRQSLGGL